MRVSVRLTPRAAADRVIGMADGWLRISVAAPPVDNAANEALLRLLARQWALPRRDLSIVAGGKSRNKIVRIDGKPTLLLKRLTPLLQRP